MVVVLGFHKGEAVDAVDDIGRVLAEAVENYAQRGLADLVGGSGNADSAFCGGKGFVTCKEGKAAGFLAQEHGGQIAVAKTHLALVGNAARNAEGLKTDTDGLCGVGGVLQPFLRAMAAPRVYAQTAFSNAMGWMERTMVSTSMPFSTVYALT